MDKAASAAARKINWAVVRNGKVPRKHCGVSRVHYILCTDVVEKFAVGLNHSWDGAKIKPRGRKTFALNHKDICTKSLSSIPMGEQHEPPRSHKTIKQWGLQRASSGYCKRPQQHQVDL